MINFSEETTCQKIIDKRLLSPKEMDRIIIKFTDNQRTRELIKSQDISCLWCKI